MNKARPTVGRAFLYLPCATRMTSPSVANIEPFIVADETRDELHRKLPVTMRIAISGSHSVGKSTVVNDWIAHCPHFKREEEPYRALGLYGPYEILFRDASTKLHNGIPLSYNIS